MNWRAAVAMIAVLVGVGFVYLITRPPEPEPVSNPRVFIWSAEMLDLDAISIALPREQLEQAWARGDDKQWYFAEPDGRLVDRQRWGGGIPLLLSGPAANRAIAEEASADQLAEYGFESPTMLISIELLDGRTIDVEVGGQSITGDAYYIRRSGSNTVYTVDFTWFNVLARLVTDPPYAPASGDT